MKLLKRKKRVFEVILRILKILKKLLRDAMLIFFLSDIFLMSIGILKLNIIRIYRDILAISVLATIK